MELLLVTSKKYNKTTYKAQEREVTLKEAGKQIHL